MSNSPHILYKLHIPGHPESAGKYTEDELQQHLCTLDHDTAATAMVWRNGMDEYSPIWTEFEWAEHYAADPSLTDTEDEVDISWLGLPEFLGGQGKWNSYKLNPILIPMVGASGVGKTSLLVAMYKQLPGAFLPDTEADGGKTNELIDEKQIELAKLTEGKAGKLLDGPAGKGTEGRHNYYFKTTARKDGNTYTQPFWFVDFAGGWFRGIDSDTEVLSVLGKAPVSLLVVDTPALMGEGSQHERINRPGRIHDLYKSVADCWRYTPRTVVVTLLKAERYIHRNQLAEVESVLRERYAPLLQLLYRHNVKVYLAPVETAGGVEFDHFDTEGMPHYRYTGAGYKPHACEIPLQICLQRALFGRIRLLQRSLDNKSATWRWIQENLLRRKYRQALNVLTDFRKDSTLCDIDIRPYRLFSNPAQERR